MFQYIFPTRANGQIVENSIYPTLLVTLRLYHDHLWPVRQLNKRPNLRGRKIITTNAFRHNVAANFAPRRYASRRRPPVTS